MSKHPLQFGTKAATLERLQGKLSIAKVLPLKRFTVGAFNANKVGLLQEIREQFGNEPTIVRSSAISEDSANASLAGCYTSIPNVSASDTAAMAQAINEVIADYPDHDLNEVFVQPMLPHIQVAGVALTADLDTLSRYYLINYADNGSSDDVTSGKGKDLKTYIQAKDCQQPAPIKYLEQTIQTCRECEQLFDNPHLDIEFAIDQQQQLYIFQVRPITKKGKEDDSQLDLSDALNKLARKLTKLMNPHPYLLGERSIFGVMPDWNPAEIIGARPRRLALSLYKELITDEIWAYQRDNYGYRSLRSHPLLVSLFGAPYIDVRVCFNSFIPKNLNDRIAEKLVNYYMNKLAATPAYHDKVEFEIVYSCYFLDLPQRLTELKRHGFNENEIKRIEFSLLEVTNNIISPETGLFQQDLDKINIMQERFEAICNADLPPIERIYWLTEDCKRFGTLPFAGIARSAFVAVQLLRSFVSCGVMTEKEYHAYLNSLKTVSKHLNQELYDVAQGEKSKGSFLEQYGHLRPGTYDILSPRYDENFDDYFSLEQTEPVHYKDFQWRAEQIDQITDLLAENGIVVGMDELFEFIQQAIEGREYAKLIFTKAVSEIIRLVAEFGGRFGLDKDALSHLDIQRILSLHACLDNRDVGETLQQNIDVNLALYKYTRVLKLPPLIINPEDVYRFYQDKEQPNFITMKRIQAPAQSWPTPNKSISLKGKIILVETADPGYDFLFTKDIAGLITKYGGTNSHMAIRCAEFGIPAVIGAGEHYFSTWSGADVLEIDGANHMVRIIGPSL